MANTGQRPTGERVAHKAIVIRGTDGSWKIERGLVLGPQLERTLRHLAEGLNQKQAAQKMQISPKTVNNFVVMLMRIFEVTQWNKLAIIGYQLFRENAGG